jgi:hypothetical protein
LLKPAAWSANVILPVWLALAVHKFTQRLGALAEVAPSQFYRRFFQGSDWLGAFDFSKGIIVQNRVQRKLAAGKLLKIKGMDSA